MRSSSSGVATARPGVVEDAFVSRWTLADLSAEVEVEVEGFPEVESESPEEARAREEAEARERAEAEARREEEARREAEREAAEAQERRVREAYEQGYEEGRRNGEIAEGARLRTALRAAEEALDELRAGEVRWAGTIEENVCALAVAVARHVIGRELEGDAGAVRELVRAALAEFPIDQPIRIRVNPSDLQAIQQGGEDVDGVLAVPRERDARWLADPQVAPGGCIVEGRDRIVDGRVDTALERIYRRITYTHA